MQQFIDIEFTGFSEDALPIQIAWTDSSGKVMSVFICYDYDIISDVWSESAEEIHGISIDFLTKYGVSPLDACTLLNDHNKGCVLLSDAILADKNQITKLFSMTDIDMEFEINDLYLLNDLQKSEYKQHLFEEEKESIFKVLNIEPHLASHDVLINNITYNKLHKFG